MNIQTVRRLVLQRLLTDRAGGNKAEFDRMYGVDATYVSQIMGGHRSIGEKSAKKIENALDLPMGYMDDLENAKLTEAETQQLLDSIDPPKTARPLKNEVTITGGFEAWDEGSPLDPDDVELPLFKEVEMSAGGGKAHAVELNHRKLKFAKTSLRGAHVQPDNAACAIVSGNSMEPKIGDGATIGIDRSRNQVKDGKIFAIDHDGMLRVKYLYRMPGGGLRLHSENDDEHPDEVYGNDWPQKIKILGWVFWWSTLDRW